MERNYFYIYYLTHITYKFIWTKRDEATGEWRKLHSEELHNLYSSLIVLGRSNQGE
jgi:hypothetical protein